jgi:hypothetical protein
MIPQFHVDTGNLRWELESLPRKLQSTVLKRVLRRPLKHTEARARALYATNRSALFREHLADHFWVKFKHYRVGVMWGAVGVRVGNTPKHIPTGKGWQKAQFLPGWRFHFLDKPVRRRNGRVSPGKNKFGLVASNLQRMLPAGLTKALDEALVSVRRAR